MTTAGLGICAISPTKDEVEPSRSTAIMIAVDLLVIWALTAHGGEMRKMDDA